MCVGCYFKLGKIDSDFIIGLYFVLFNLIVKVDVYGYEYGSDIGSEEIVI